MGERGEGRGTDDKLIWTNANLVYMHHPREENTVATRRSGRRECFDALLIGWSTPLSQSSNQRGAGGEGRTRSAPRVSFSAMKRCRS
jgi:hypothetical protein